MAALFSNVKMKEPDDPGEEYIYISPGQRSQEDIGIRVTGSLVYRRREERLLEQNGARHGAGLSGRFQTDSGRPIATVCFKN